MGGWWELTCLYTDPGQNYGHLYLALVLKFSGRDRPVSPYSCPRRDDDVGPRKIVVRMGGHTRMSYPAEAQANRNLLVDMKCSRTPHFRSQSQTQPTSTYYICLHKIRYGNFTWTHFLIMRNLI